jgi:formylglycine-generating enzyme required for sulfatase activity
MSKYETTNAQYCQYLNEALACGDVVIQSGEVYGSGGPYDGKIYYDMDDTYAQISHNGSEFYVETRDGYDMSDHPVVEVSWYGAMSFADYYGWRLPTEWEWQAVADYDGSYTYGCGETINHSKANYDKDNPLNLSSYPYTSPVGYYPSYGYGMCDMAGNVWEWTSSVSGSYRVIRGGSWPYYDSSCEVSDWGNYNPGSAVGNGGFRVCR